MIAVQEYSGRPAEWDAFVMSQSEWTHFHRFGWKRLMEDVFAHECLYLAVSGSEGRLTGVLPLVRVRSVIFGHYLVSMPFVNCVGPLGDSDSTRALANHAVQLASRDGVTLLELRCRSPRMVDLPVSQRKVTVLLELPPGDAAPLWDRLGSRLRSQIRRPQKEGVTVRFGLEQVGPFYDVFSRHMRDLGTPVQSRSLFDAIATQFPEDVWFGCAYLRGQPIAAGCGFRWDREFELTWASALRRYNPIAPNMLLYWEFMQRCAQEGVGVFNFGRCTPGSGTHRFKRQWGGRDVPLHWYQFSASGSRGTPSPDDTRYAWGPRLWKRLPLPVANLLGPRIVRAIP